MVVVDEPRYEFFTRVVYDHNSLAKSPTDLFRDASDEAGRPCVLVSTVSGNMLRLLFDERDVGHQWLAAMRAAYQPFAPG